MRSSSASLSRNQTLDVVVLLWSFWSPVNGGRHTSIGASRFWMKTAWHTEAEVVIRGDSEQKESDIRNIHCCIWARIWKGERERQASRRCWRDFVRNKTNMCVREAYLSLWGFRNRNTYLRSCWTFKAFLPQTEPDRSIVYLRGGFWVFEGSRTERNRHV